YQATNGVINKYTPSGVLVGSITLTGPDAVGASSRDGFEVQNNPNINGGATTFIANRYDGGFGHMNGNVVGAYDVYDSNGVEIIPAFITPNAQGTAGATGIAYDGNHYFVSDIYNNRLFEYDGLGVFIRNIDLSANPNPPSGTRFLEDLSAVGNTVTNPVCGNHTVEPPETCDPPGSACGALLTCDAGCQCLGGNGVIDPSEECDPPGSTCSDGSSVCASDCTCQASNTTTTTTSTTPSTSTTTTTSSTTTTTTLLDHFQCYEVKPKAFATIPGLPLEDRFGHNTETVRFPSRLCAPADKLGEDPTTPTHPEHLIGHLVSGPNVKVAGQTLMNQFGTIKLDVVKPDILMVPTLKTL